MNLKGSKVLVSGGAGFIGIHTCRELIDWGANVRVFDNFKRSTMNQADFERRIRTRASQVEVICGDLTKKKDCQEAVKGADFVIHLGALISVPESMKKQEEYYLVNVGGMENILRASVKAGVKRFVFASSCAVYGDLKRRGYIPIAEDHPLDPKSFYASTKEIGENMLKAQCDLGHIYGVILRYFNVYGIGQSPAGGAVVPKFLDAVENYKPVNIYGDGEQIRDFVYVKDVAVANRKALTNGKSGEVYNICTEEGVSINRLYALAKRMVNPKHNLVKKMRKRSGDIDGFIGSCYKSIRELDFRAKYRVDQGIRDMVILE